MSLSAASPTLPTQRWSLSFPPSNGTLSSSFSAETIDQSDLPIPRRGSAPATYNPTPRLSARASLWLPVGADDDAGDDSGSGSGSDAERQPWRDGVRSRSTSAASHYGRVDFSEDPEDASGWKGLKRGVKGARRRSLPTLSLPTAPYTISFPLPISIPLSTPPESRPDTGLYFPSPRVARSARVRPTPLFTPAPPELEQGPLLPNFYEFLSELDPELQPLSHWMPQSAEVEVLNLPDEEEGEVQVKEAAPAAVARLEARRPAPLELGLAGMASVVPRLRRNDTIREESEHELELDASGISSGTSSPTHTLLFSPHPSPTMSECDCVGPSATSGPPPPPASAPDPTHSPYWSPTADAIEWSACSDAKFKGLKPLRLPAMVSLGIKVNGRAHDAEDVDFPVLVARAPTPLPARTAAAGGRKGRKAIVIGRVSKLPPMLPMVELDVEPQGSAEGGEPNARASLRRASLHEQFWDALEDLEMVGA